MLVVQRKLDAAGAARRGARAAVRAAAEEPAAHDASPAARRSASSSRAAPCCATATACAADDGRVVRVVAADEDLLEVRCDDADALARAAYHLGNRHAPVQVGAGWLRFAADDVLARHAARTGRDGDADPRAVRARGRRVRRRPPRAFGRGEARRHHPRLRCARRMRADRDAARSPDAATVAAAARAPAAAREPDAAGRRVQLFAGAGIGGRGGDVRDAATRAGVDRRRARVRRRAAAKRRSRGGCSRAAQRGDWAAFATWNAWFRASRETAELRAETVQMGGSLAKLAGRSRPARRAGARDALAALAPVTLPAAFALAARGVRDPRRTPRSTAYLWSWLENQVLAAVKLVPLGQVAGQRLLHGAGRADSARSSRPRTTLADDDAVDASRPGSRSRQRAARNAVHAALSFLDRDAR